MAVRTDPRKQGKPIFVDSGMLSSIDLDDALLTVL